MSTAPLPSSPSPGAGRPRLVDDRGRACFGSYDDPLDFNLSAFRLRGFFGRPAGPLRRRLALGGFSFLGVTCGPVQAGVAAVRLGYASQVFAYVFDAASGRWAERAVKAPPGAMAFPLDSEASDIRFQWGRHRLHLDKDHARGTLRLEAELGGLSLEGTFRCGYGFSPLRVVNPSCGDPLRVTFTEKCAPLPAEAFSVAIAGDPWAVDGEAWAIHDWSAGYFARHTNWLWAAFGGRLADGTPVGANFAALVNESFYPENAYWIGGQRTRVPRVIFDWDPEHLVDAPWRIHTEDGDLDLRFTPDAHRGERTWLPGLRVNFRQCLGTYAGRMGGVLVTGLRGFAEHHLSVW